LDSREVGVAAPARSAFRGLSSLSFNVLDPRFELGTYQAQLKAVIDMVAVHALPTDALAGGRLLYCRGLTGYGMGRPSEMRRRLVAAAERREGDEAGWKGTPTVAEFDIGSTRIVASVLPLQRDEFLRALQGGSAGREFVVWTPEAEVTETYVRDLYLSAFELTVARPDLGRLVVARCGRGEIIWFVELLQGEVEMQCGVYGRRELLEPFAACAGFEKGRGGVCDLGNTRR
jgi:hypothetical protein